MPSTTKNVDRVGFDDSKRILKEAEIAMKRGLLIAFFCEVLDLNDRHGAIEAFQHSMELGLKSFWRLLGFPYPKDHNPTDPRDPRSTTLDEVNRRLFELRPDFTDNPLFKRWDVWVRVKGQHMKILHEQAMYGDEATSRYASELFTVNDMDKEREDCALVFNFVKMGIMVVGLQEGFLSAEEIKEFEKWYDLILQIVRTPGASEAMDRFTENRFRL